MRTSEVDISPLQSGAAKMFRRVVPLTTAAFVIAYIDRVNVGYAREALEADLGIGAAAYGIGAGIFFIAYALFEVPSNLLMRRVGAKAWLTRIMVSWGVVSVAMALVQGEVSFFVLRFLLGVAEAGFVPGVYLLLSQVLPNSHRGRAVSIFLMGSAFATIIAGPFSGLLLGMDGFAGVTGWQWMFAIQGGMALVFAPLMYRLTMNSVQEVPWLSAAEKSALAEELRQEQAERDRGHGPAKPSVWSLLMKPSVVLLAWLYFSGVTLIYATTFWLPTIVHGFGGLSDIEVGLISSIPWVVAMGGMWLFGRSSDRVTDRRPLISACFVLASIGMYVSTLGNPVLQMAALSLAAIGFKSVNAITVAISQRLLDVRIAAAGLALITAMGNVGGFVAPTLFGFVEDATGTVTAGIYTFAATSVLAALSAFLLPRVTRRDPAAAARPAGDAAGQAGSVR
ncbi:MFS transporter [Prauserella cavernicola]|uniref:MFS transporter n=1 Tax=Prauserella cavernicola TaxID=2800127 RepID=A0A934V813_9PSEU|nr:MFS transporter [Prauserella cavernicola]MBK1789177.1 MFS transporter [Prauserella cavernicola]